MNKEQACPVCKSKSFRDYKFNLQFCEACKLIVSPEIWRVGTNKRMVETWFAGNFQKESSFWVRLFDARTNNVTLARLDSFRLPGMKLLEVGVGRGSFLNAAKMRGYEVMGCDLSDTICHYVEDLYGIPMHCGSLESLEGECKFDVVIMNHVLEHVHEPTLLLSEVNRLLKPGGVIHIVVPNASCWEACLRGWGSYEPYHLTYLNPSLLKRVCLVAGFENISIETHESFSGWFLAVIRTMLGVKREQGMIERKAIFSIGLMSRLPWIDHSYRLAMVSAGLLSWPLRLVQARLGFGDEVVCIIQKQ